MKPVLTVAEMRAVDEAAQASTSIETLIERAGAAVARRALALLGGGYGRRVVAVCGKGHNGDDGRVAAGLLATRGVLVVEVAPGEDIRDLGADLVIDAAFGTGLRGDYDAPEAPAGATVLSVDVPTGLDADTGAAAGAVRAGATVTFGALKPGLLLGSGPELAGMVEVDRIGLDLGTPTISLVEDADVTANLEPRPREAHKWQRALYVLAGSPGMLGAARLAATAALRAGAGMVRLGSPGSDAVSGVTEAVSRPLSRSGYAPAVLEELARCRALVCGPGLGQAEGTREAVLQLLAESPVPVVLDADGLNAIGELGAAPPEHRSALVLTPHDGEFARLAGAPPGPDRIAAARALAERARAVVLLKGPTTVVADPNGATLLCTSGTPALATGGTGDVLSGVIGAFVARGVEPRLAAALAAHVHGRAARRGPTEGLVAGDLPLLVAATLSGLVAS